MTAGVYLLFHLRLGSDVVATLSGTMSQVLLTAPYALGFTYITAAVFKKMTDATRLPWDRLLRIYFTVGILFAFFFALYEYAGGGTEPTDIKSRLPILSGCLEDDNQKQRWCLA